MDPGTRIEVDKHGVAKYKDGLAYLPLMVTNNIEHGISPITLSCWSATSPPTEYSAPVTLAILTAIAGGPAYPQETETEICHGTTMRGAFKILSNGLGNGHRHQYGNGPYVTADHNNQGELAQDLATLYAVQAARKGHSTPAVLSGIVYGKVVHCPHQYDLNNQASAGRGPFACDIARPNAPITENKAAKATYLRLPPAARVAFNELDIDPSQVVYADEAKRAAAAKVAADVNTHAAYANTLEKAAYALLQPEALAFSKDHTHARAYHNSRTKYLEDPAAFGASSSGASSSGASSSSASSSGASSSGASSSGASSSGASSSGADSEVDINELIDLAYKYRDTVLTTKIAENSFTDLFNNIATETDDALRQDKLRFALQAGASLKQFYAASF